MVERLLEGERCVCELREEVGGDLSTVSRHLAMLKNAGLATSEKRGQQVFYRLAPLPLSPLLERLEELAAARASRTLEARDKS